MMAEVVRERLARADAAGGFLLDGYPRTPAQAETLDEILAERGEDLVGVISLSVPEEILLARASHRGRVDDGAEVMRERLRVYGEQTRPLVDHYRGRGLLYEVDGDRAVPAVTDAIVAALGGLPGGS